MRRSVGVLMIVGWLAGGAGCAGGEKEKFSQAVLSEAEIDRIKAEYIDKDVAAAFIAKTSEQARFEYRNEVLRARMRYINGHYAALEERIRKGRAGVAFGVDVTTLTLNTVGSLTGAEATKSILHAISAGLIGSHAAFEKNFFQDQAPNVIIPEMQALRALQKKRIELQMELPTARYSMQAALSDADEYLRAGSITAALISLSNKSGAAATKATEETDRIIERRYERFNPSVEAGRLRDAITQWWQNGGSTFDSARTAQLGAHVPVTIRGNEAAIVQWLNGASDDELRGLAQSLKAAGIVDVLR